MKIAGMLGGLPHGAVALPWGSDTVSLEIRALPIGFDDRIRDRIPDPVPPAKGVMVDPKSKKVLTDKEGRPLPNYQLYDPGYRAALRKAQSRRTILMLVGGLAGEPRVAFEAKPPESETPADWEAYADAVEAELAGFGFSEGHVIRIVNRVMQVSGISTEEIEGARASFLPQEG